MEIYVREKKQKNTKKQHLNWYFTNNHYYVSVSILKISFTLSIFHTHRTAYTRIR